MWQTILSGVTDMFSLATIQRMNNAVEARKARRRAQALNAKNKKHPKNAEKTGTVVPVDFETLDETHPYFRRS